MSSRDARRLAVPKFTSFKPKPASTEQPASALETSDVADDDARRSRKRRHHRSHKTPRDERPRSQGRSRNRSRSRSQSPRAETLPAGGTADQGTGWEGAPSATDQANLPLFVVDKKGDPLIRRYGVDKYKAPQFRREGREGVLGAEGYLYIHRDAADEQFSIRRPGQLYGSSRDRNPFKSRIRHVPARRLRAGRDANSRGVDSGDFISLTTRRNRTRREEELSDDGGQPDYRSIEGSKSRAALDSDADTESTVCSDDDDVRERDPFKERSAALTRRVKETPGDIPAWLELIDHQDVLMKAGADINEDVPVDEVKSFAEIKLSMYDKALSHVRSPRDRERLLVGQMREGARVWDEDAMATRWSKLSNELDTSFALWRASLDFEMSNIKTFHYDRVKKILERRLALLSARAVEQLVPPHELRFVYSEMIYVFLRATRFFHDCGYRELSVAAWQALLELNFTGNGFSTPQASTPDDFEDFWESEVPRIGEEGAMGWDHFARTGGPDVPEPAAAGGEAPSQSRDVYKAWAVEEVHRERKARMPARTLDDTDENDPYGIVMFSDIKAFVFAIPRDILREAKAELFDAFLTFCHLPRLSKNRPWESDPFVAPIDMAFSDAIANTFAALPSRHLFGPDEDSSRPPPEFATRRVSPAVAPTPICSLVESGGYAAQENAPVDLGWVGSALETLVERGHLELARYYLAVEWSVDRAGVRNAAKGLIRRYPKDVGLYNLYGLLEWTSGNTDMAKNVWSSATRLGEASSADILPLWLTWAWVEFVDGAAFSKVLSRLCFSADRDSAEGPSPTAALRQKQELGSQSVGFLLQGDLEGFSVAAKMTTLLEYLCSPGGSEPRSERQGSISSAMEAVWRFSGALVSANQRESTQHEELLNFAAMLLYVHTTLGPYRKVFLSTQLRKCILLFPTNTSFLMLFDWAESNLRVNDEFRNVLTDHVLTRGHDTVGLRTLAVKRELANGSVYTAAAAFERALDSDAGRNPWFWTCYVRFCRGREGRDDGARGRGKRDDRARDLGKKAYYRGLAKCPWAKELAMEGFGTLVRGMASAELKGAYGSMEEKGLRVHVDMGAFAERRRGR